MKRIFVTIILLAVMFLPVSCVIKDPIGITYYTVIFCGENIEDFSFMVKEGDSAVEPQAPTGDGEFLYWATEDGNAYDFSQPVDEDITLYAVWKREQPKGVFFTVRFFDVDGQLINTQQVEEGKAAVNPAVTISDFFVFDGWDKDFSCITSDLDVYARRRYNSIAPEFFTYSRNSDMSFTITGISGELPQSQSGYVKLALPTHFNNIPITAIADGINGKGVFSGKNILSVYVPSSYKKIGAYAFADNPALTSVTFSEGLREIGEGAFMATLSETGPSGPYAHSGLGVYVSALTQVSLPASLRKIGAYAFYHIGNSFSANTYSSQEVKLTIAPGSKLSLIGKHAFEGAMIYDIDLSPITDTLTIDSYAFAADTYLNYIYVGSYEYPRSITARLVLPKSISFIGDYSFYGLGNMSSYYNGSCTVTVSDVSFSCDGLINVGYLGDYAFYGAALKGDLWLKVQDLSKFAFYGQKLSNITLERVLTVGPYAFARSEGEESLSVDLGSALISVGDGAFCNNRGLTSVTIPASLISIGDLAFSGCADLEGTMTLPTALTSVGTMAFASSGVEYIEIRGSAAFGRRCFENSALKQVRGNISAVDEGTFEGCKDLTSVTLPSGLTELPEDLFYGCTSLNNITFPESLSVIGRTALGGCTALSSITLPENLTEIGVSAFERCSALENITFSGDNLIKIDSYAFAFCMALENINLPDSVCSIGDCAFRGTGLTSFTTPASLESMGRRVFLTEEYIFGSGGSSDFPFTPFETDDDLKVDFNRQDGLPQKAATTKITVPVLTSFKISRETNEIKFSEQGTFDGASVQKFEVEQGNTFYSIKDDILYDIKGEVLIMYMNGNSVSSLAVPDGTVEIANGAFYNNKQLNFVTFPTSLVSIGDYAFFGCTHLRSVSLNNNITKVGDYSFAGSAGNMSELASINMYGSNLQTIGAGAFQYNKALSSVQLPASLVMLGDRAFYSASALAKVDLTEAKNFSSIGRLAFSGDVGSTPLISSIDFSDCESLTSTGSYAFAGCAKLVSIDFGNLTEIDSGAFDNCIAIKNITLGEKITDIGSSAFHACTSLAEIIVPKDCALEHIMYYAFAGSLDSKMIYSSLDLSNATNLKDIGDYAFAYGNVTSVKLPSAAFDLGDDVFNSCELLTDVEFGTVNSIGENVFRKCTALTKISLPASVKSIDKDAFRSLNLIEAEICTTKDHDLTIGMSAFFDCTALKTVSIAGDGVPQLVGAGNNHSFHTSSGGIIAGLKILVDSDMLPSYSLGGYDSMGWSVYKDIISQRQ